MKTNYIPLTQQEVQDNGWESLDVILVSGDAYVDHPSFAAAIIGRYLISQGYRVGIIDQPVTDDDYQRLGKPNLFFGISSGNMDSMVNHYTAQRKIRSEDAYSPNGQTGLRPDRAILVYTQKVKQFFKDVPVVIGGVEASMRRIPHYDYWSDKIRNSILFDSKANILVYGNGERQILEIAQAIQTNKSLQNIKGTCIISNEQPEGTELISSYQDIKDKQLFWEMTKIFTESFNTKTLYYRFQDRYFVHNIPAEPFATQEIDFIYSLPFSRDVHPKYKGKRIKAFEQIKFSILSHRGCYGGCSFCTIGFHQGKTIQSRSKDSIISELNKISTMKYFRKTITDISGASANMYGTFCKANISETCSRISCLYPEICNNLVVNEKPYISVLKAARLSKKVNNVFISSGVRFDLALKQQEFIQDLAVFHTSGLLKLAPEHISENVLTKMFKPSIKKYLEFAGIYADICKKIEKKQYIIPYLIVGFPGTSLDDALDLAIFLKQHNLQVEQIQEFTPTPMTIATMMYYTGMDYEDSQKRIFVPKGREIRLQKALAQWFIKSNKKLVFEALKAVNKLDCMNFFYRKEKT
jgi:uncharacterized radical SAM protein YgiQ